MRNWKRPNTETGPSLQVMMEAASQRFLTRVGFKPMWHILSKWSSTLRRPRASVDKS